MTRVMSRTFLIKRRATISNVHRVLVGPLISTPKFSTTTPRYASATTESETEFVPGARWLTDTSARVGKCLTFGCSTAQVAEAGCILAELGTGWRELTAGSEGFLTEYGRRGLWRYPVAWGDQDAMVSHVNNVSYVRYCESARVNWAYNFANLIDPENKVGWEELISPRGYGVIIRSIKVDYKFPMQFPDRICGFHKLRAMPEAEHDSMILDVIIMSEKHRRPVARAVEDIVLYNYQEGTKASLDTRPFVLDAFQKTFKLQEEAAMENQRRVKMIEEKVRALEQGSWDREGAVEDFGSSGGKK